MSNEQHIHLIITDAYSTFSYYEHYLFHFYVFMNTGTELIMTYDYELKVRTTNQFQ